MINILLVLNIVVVILLIGIILLQKSEGGVLGMGGGSRNAVLSARVAGGMVTKITYTLGALFFIICIALAILIARKSEGSKSFVEMMAERGKSESAREVGAPPTAKVPEDSMDESKPEAKFNDTKGRPAVPRD
jgi:preprotein translocase subunit SecG